MADIKKLAHEVYPYVVEMRRDFHRHPEASFEEFRTTKRIAEELDKMGIPYRLFEPTGLVGEIKGGKPGKCIALRADIDALTTTEKTGLPYASENEGYMHACGHDTHTAMLLGAAKILSSVKDELCGTVKLIFQPAAVRSASLSRASWTAWTPPSASTSSPGGPLARSRSPRVRSTPPPTTSS